MKITSKIISNVGLMSLAIILFAGCSLLPAKVDNSVDYKVTVEDESYTELSDDDSMETIDQELDDTSIEDEDLTKLESELQLDLDTTMEK